MSHVSTFNSICYFKGQSFKVMLPSHNFSQLSSNLYTDADKNTHIYLHAPTNTQPSPSLIFITLFPFPYGLRPHWRAECTDPTLLHQGSPGGLGELSVKLLVKLPPFVKHYFCNQGQKGALVFMSRREGTLVQTAPNLGSHLWFPDAISKDKPHCPWPTVWGYVNPWIFCNSKTVPELCLWKSSGKS